MRLLRQIEKINKKCLKMKKWISIIILIFLTIPIVYGICCEKNQDCVIAETCPDGGCGNCTIQIYNRIGTINVTTKDMALITDYTYIYNISKNLTNYGIYPYIINCTSNKVCKGDCEIEIKSECEKDDKMIIAITIFLMIINVGLFLAPVMVKDFTVSVIGNYIIRKSLVIVGLLFLWFNTTILRTLAIDYGLGIDNLLEVYWWIFTLVVFISIFVLIYIHVIGLLKLIKQVKTNQRMNAEYGQERV